MNCGDECEACLICENEKRCCAHNPKSYSHGCVTWPRKKKKTTLQKLDDIAEGKVKESGNPFKDITLTDEEREWLAEGGIV